MAVLAGLFSALMAYSTLDAWLIWTSFLSVKPNSENLVKTFGIFADSGTIICHETDFVSSSSSAEFFHYAMSLLWPGSG